MGKKPNKKASGSPPDLNEIDQFLEGGVDALPPSARSQNAGAQPSTPPPQKSPRKTENPRPDESQPAESAPQKTKRKLSVWVSDDGMEAGIRSIFPETTAEDIQDVLSRNGIVTGIDEAAINRTVKTAQETQQPIRDVIVAKGTPSRPPGRTRLGYLHPETHKGMAALDPIAKLLSESDPKVIRSEYQKHSVWAVSPGVRLAQQVTPPGEPGSDVRGKPVEPESPTEARAPNLHPGSGVKQTGMDFEAAQYGFAGLLDGQVTVLSPIWTSEDAMQAALLNLPLLPESHSPSVSDLRNLLRDAKVQPEFLDEKKLGAAINAFGKPTPIALFELAQGKLAVPPENPDPAIHFPHMPLAGTLRPDGSIDFKERSQFPSVEKDMCIAECESPKPGKPGKTLTGDAIEVPPPIVVEFVGDENVRIETSGNRQRAFSEIEGGASVRITQSRAPEAVTQTCTFAVRPVAQIPGDIGYSTGNIDFKGNVEIRGNITSGFRVTATGDIAVLGTVESDTQVAAGRDLSVQLGIVGENTRVSAAGNLNAKFIQDAQVSAKGDILVGSYIYSANVQAGDAVRVEGRGGSGGGIVGGQTWAGKTIATRNLGSERNASTRVHVGIDQGSLQKLEKSHATEQQARRLSANLLEHIGLSALKAEAVRDLIARHPARKNLILHYVKKANQLAQVQNAQIEEQQKLSQEISRSARHATIDVMDTASNRVHVQIGKAQMRTTDVLQRVRFALVDGVVAPLELKPETKA